MSHAKTRLQKYLLFTIYPKALTGSSAGFVWLPGWTFQECCVLANPTITQSSPACELVVGACGAAEN